MILDRALQSCVGFLNSQLQPSAARQESTLSCRFVTLSRESGTAAHGVAELLAAHLRDRDAGARPPWTVFDGNLVEAVLEDHHLPKRLMKYMPEDRITEIADIMDELFGLHPSSWTLAHKTSETMLRLAEMGHCILIGRGAPVVTAKLRHGFHVRLIGSLERRVERLQRLQGLDHQEALERVRQRDLGRQRYMKKYFHKSVHDPLLYHVTINTDHFSTDEAARMIAEAICRGPTPHATAPGADIAALRSAPCPGEAQTTTLSQ